VRFWRGDLRHSVCTRGWPFASLGVALVGSPSPSSANTPTRCFAANIVIAMLSRAACGRDGVLILDGVDQFPLLAIGMAPVVPRRRPAVDQPQSATGLDRILALISSS